ncbi:MAG: rhodanese-like domain-containing protein [Trueperaceae bacterium]|nr:rhodanese-like domain-containing protein [Trueperaceae bacterium]
MSWGRRPTLPEATVEELVADDDPAKIVIDVREPMETMYGTIEGARLVPLGEIESVIDELDDDANVYLVCRSGNRSAYATEVLMAAGKTGAKNVVGGMIAWAQAGLPIER